MTQPTNEAINQTLAEFMGFKDIKHADGMTYIDIADPIVYITVFNYTKSLDACIPVAEKVKKERDFIFKMCFSGANSNGWVINARDGSLLSNDESFPLALSTALYHVIKELK